jgi:YD repeat-containing protein
LADAKSADLRPTARVSAVLILLAVALALIGVGRAAAQTAPLPAMQIVKGVPISPAAAQTVYAAISDGQTHHDGLCRDFAANAALCVSSSANPTPPEIVELAKALHYDPNLIYEYIRNSIDTEFLFGAHKGPLGVIIDRSGTAFDQAELMVALLSVPDGSGHVTPAHFQYGTITLSASQFTDWTGLNTARSACEFLATGGIPFSIGGSTPTSCADGSMDGALPSSIVVGHVWVKADLTGGSFVFDPAYKPYQHKSGLVAGGQLTTAMGLTTGAPLSTATSTKQSGPSGGTNSYNRSGLESLLKTTYGANLLTRLRAADMQGADMTDVVGGHVIMPATRPTAGWLQTSLPYSTTLVESFDAVPDKYRAKLVLFSDYQSAPTTRTTLISATFFTDEIYGRRLELGSHPNAASGMPDATATSWSPTLSFDGVVVQTGPAIPSVGSLALTLSMTADHPFAANGGTGVHTYGDATIFKAVNYLMPATIVHSWGRVSSNLGRKWEQEQASDKEGPIPLMLSAAPDLTPQEAPDSGDLFRARVAATWLAQFSRATDLHAEIANSRSVQLHNLGVVSTNQATVPQPPAPGVQVDLPPVGFVVLDETTVVDIETSIGLVSRTSDATSRRAALHAIAATGAALEGSVIGQLADSPDATSTAARFAWGNNPDFFESSPPSQAVAPRNFYRFSTAAAGSTASSVTQYDGGTTAPGAWGGLPAIDQGTADGFRTMLSTAIGDYAGAGYDVVAPGESSLGPGARLGSEYASFTISFPQGGSVSISGTSISCAALKASMDEVPCATNAETAVLDASISNSQDQQSSTVRTGYYRTSTLQRGGALVATLYGAGGNDDPLRIAHILTRLGPPMKGGGGPSVSQIATYNPSEAAQSLKDRFVDRSSAQGVDLSSGKAGFHSPVLVSKGQGEFPHRLQRTFSMNDRGETVDDWNHSIEFGNSGLELMGSSRVDAAIPTIVAFKAMQDVWASTPSAEREVVGELVANWWTDHLVFDVATAHSGASARQFVRLIDDSFVPTSGGPDRLLVTGARQAVRPQLIISFPDSTRIDPSNAQHESVMRAWRYDNVTAQLKGGQGDTQTYGFFTTTPISGTTESRAHEWVLSSWTFPQGVTLTVTNDHDRPTNIQSNLGVSIDLSYSPWPAPLYSPTGACSVMPFADPAGAITELVTRPPVARAIGQRPDPWCHIWQVYSPLDLTPPTGQPFLPSLQYAYNTVGQISTASDPIAIRTPTLRNPHRFFIAEGYRGERQDPTGAFYAAESMQAGNVTLPVIQSDGTVLNKTGGAASLSRNIDELGRVVTTYRDGRGHTLAHVYPEGDQDLFAYDANDNVVQLTKRAKPGSFQPDGSTPWPDITVKATWETTWNKLASITDAKGATTTLSYFSAGATTGSASMLQQAQRPAVGGVTPTYAFTYDSFGRPARVTDPDGVAIASDYDSTTHFLKHLIVDPDHLASTTTFGTDTVGNVTSMTDSRGFVSNAVYDADRRKVWEIGPADPNSVTPTHRPTVRHSYDANGREYQVDKGFSTAFDSNGAPTDFSSLDMASTAYDAADNKVFIKTQTGRTQVSYDGMNRVVCAAQRMNAGVADGALPSDACQITSITTATPEIDRIAKTEYTPAGETFKLWRAFNAPVDVDGVAQQQLYATYAYGQDGETLSVQDARRNLTTYAYDGFNRLNLTRYPVTTAQTDTSTPASNPGDTETYLSDVNGNRVQFKKRDGSVLSFCYDPLNRQTVKYLHAATGCPSTTGADVTTAYTPAGRPTTILFANGQGITYAWDTAGRALSAANNNGTGRTLGYGYDLSGNLTQVTWPDGFYAGYVYDSSNRVSRICQNAADAACVSAATLPATTNTASGLLAVYKYDDLGHRTAIVRANGTSTTYAYSNPELLTGLTQDLAGSANDQTWGFGYNQAPQVTSRSTSNALYAWTPPTLSSPAAKTYDGLNRDATIAIVGTQPCGAAGGYDCNGNVLNDGTHSYAYDVENRLTSAGTISPAATVLTLGYDPMGRLNQTVAGAATTQFLYDGDRLSAEYNGTGAGTLLRRYVHGPGVDEPLVWYDVSGSSSTRHWLHADHQGSVVAWTDDNGANAVIQAYGPYGEPTSWTGSRFAYTGRSCCRRRNSITTRRGFISRARDGSCRRIRSGIRPISTSTATSMGIH